MHKRIFILLLGLIVLISAVAIISNRNVTKAPKEQYKMIPLIPTHKMTSANGNVLMGSMAGFSPGATSSANYKLTSGIIDLAPENEEVYSQ